MLGKLRPETKWMMLINRIADLLSPVSVNSLSFSMSGTVPAGFQMVAVACLPGLAGGLSPWQVDLYRLAYERARIEIAQLEKPRRFDPETVFSLN